MLGEENPADLFTKHIESGKKLEQFVIMFNCEFRDGRPAAAPKLKRAAQGAEGGCATAAIIVAGRLPHLHSDADIEKEFPAAVPPAKRRGEEDVPPERELGDPVPRLSRGQSAQGRPLHTGVRRREAHADLVRTGKLATCFADLPARAARTGGHNSPYGPWGGV